MVPCMSMHGAVPSTQAFPPSDDNQYRHLRLYEFSDIVQRIPAEHLHGMHQGGGAGAAAAGTRSTTNACGSMQRMLELLA